MRDRSLDLLSLMKRGASAAELDQFLADLRIEREIRRRAESLVMATMNPRNLHVLNDLMRAAVELTE